MIFYTRCKSHSNDILIKINYPAGIPIRTDVVVVDVTTLVNEVRIVEMSTVRRVRYKKDVTPECDIFFFFFNYFEVTS